MIFRGTYNTLVTHINRTWHLLSVLLLVSERRTLLLPLGIAIASTLAPIPIYYSVTPQVYLNN